MASWERLQRELDAVGITVETIARARLSSRQRRILKLVMKFHSPSPLPYERPNVDVECEELKLLLGEESPEWKKYKRIKEL